MPKLRDLKLPKLRAEVAFEPATLNADARTIEVRFYSGASVERYPIFADPYTLTFDLGGARLGRLNAGAPFLANHNHESLANVIGVVEGAWIARDGGHAKVRFSEREDVEPIFSDVVGGILRNVSMGAVIHELREITEKGAEQRHYLATDWEVHELSLVPVGADPGAQALSTQQPELFRCSLLSSAEVGVKETRMSETIDTEKVEQKPDAPAPDTSSSKVTAALEADKAHAEQIRRISEHYKLDEMWSQRHIKLSTPLDQALSNAIETRRDRAPKIDGALTFGEDFESKGWKIQRMAEALAARGRREGPPEPARQYAQHSLAECAYECLSFAGEQRGRFLDARRDPDGVIGLALHTQSDFPLLLANVLNKMLVPAYELAQPTYRLIAARKSFNDFRPHRFLKAGDFPVPLQVNEHGEYQHGTMSETNEIVSCVTYGRILGITRQVLVNDDLGAFNEIAASAGRRVADFENTTFFTTCITAGAGLGPTLVEGAVAVYNAAHGNLTGAGALDNTRLAAGLALMMAQTSLDGLKLNVMPRILLVSPTSYVTGKTLVAAITPAVAANVNPFAGELAVLADANLTGTRFYMLADPGVLPNYIYGTLGAAGGPRTEVRNGFEVDGIEVKLSLDFGCGAIEYRGGVSGAGA